MSRMLADAINITIKNDDSCASYFVRTGCFLEFMKVTNKKQETGHYQ